MQQWETALVGDVRPRACGSVLTVDGREHCSAKEEGQSPIEGARHWGWRAEGTERRVARAEQFAGILDTEIDHPLISVRPPVCRREIVRRRRRAIPHRTFNRARCYAGGRTVEKENAGCAALDGRRIADPVKRRGELPYAHATVGNGKEGCASRHGIVRLRADAEDQRPTLCGNATFRHNRQRDHYAVVVVREQNHRVRHLLGESDICLAAARRRTLVIHRRDGAVRRGTLRPAILLEQPDPEDAVRAQGAHAVALIWSHAPDRTVRGYRWRATLGNHHLHWGRRCLLARDRNVGQRHWPPTVAVQKYHALVQRIAAGGVLLRKRDG